MKVGVIGGGISGVSLALKLVLLKRTKINNRRYAINLCHNVDDY